MRRNMFEVRQTERRQRKKGEKKKKEREQEILANIDAIRQIRTHIHTYLNHASNGVDDEATLADR